MGARPAMRLLSCLSVCVLALVAAGPALALTQGSGFRWFWRGSSGGSTTHKFSISSGTGSTTGTHSMVVVRVKDSTGRTVVLDPANPHTSRRVVHGFSGKGANKATFTVTKTIGGISSNGEIVKPSKYMQPPPVTPVEAPAAAPEPARWFRPPSVDATPAPTEPPTTTTTARPTRLAQLSRLIVGPPTEEPPTGGYLPPSAPLTEAPSAEGFVPELTGASAPAPTPTPASHVAKDIRRNLSGRVDGSVFFGILPVINDLQRTPQAKTEPPPKVIISRRPGKCPFINMMRCPAPSVPQSGRCSNDSQCPTEQRCCYNPCAASSQCLTAVL
ncbi:hypothetical protein FJT64_017576 [Amphibalanus amphitrite]|uniref:WAP domain-containing protein n=1 Tax=Amphibalanus amphitrite TaxID=1232801 RepID=A0A6A4XB95_AMPAM|nr:hypothetical protein FJT64_017576 [Amphibalanus amphitrite]